MFVQRADNFRGEPSLVFKPADEHSESITSRRYFLPAESLTSAQA